MSWFDEYALPAKPAAPAPSMTELLGIGDRGPVGPALVNSLGGQPVGESRDLHRVLELPRRARPDLDKLVLQMNARHGKGDVPCECETRYKRRCCKSGLQTQAWALDEISSVHGILGPIAVGDGKTLLDLLAAMALPDCKVAVLLIPPSLRAQMLTVDWDFYAQHWNLPNRSDSRWFTPGLPMLHVVSYSELSSAKSSDLLEQIQPDLVIADEAHLLQNRTAARTKRFMRHFSRHPETRFLCWSGTLTTKSHLDYAPLAALALKDGSPAALHYPTQEEWAGALDPSLFPNGAGKLLQFCNPGEKLVDGYRRRLEDTAGVVSSPPTMNCSASLVIRERSISTPASISSALMQLYTTWQRPDGEELVSALDVHRCAKEISAGLYNHWIWPRKEPLEVRQLWLARRKEWHKEMREKLKQSREFLDSPLLCAKAAIRWYEGYVHVDEQGARHEISPRSKNGPHPTWEAETWLPWKEVRETCEPQTEGVWIDKFLVEDAGDWARQNVGIVWYEHDLFGRELARHGGFPYFGPGADASSALLLERGGRSIVASIRAHGTGKNLQCFQAGLVANSPSDAAVWEQLIGRTHRQGQLADEVTVDLYRHTQPVIEALDRARMLAGYIAGTMGGPQKLLKATWLLNT